MSKANKMYTCTVVLYIIFMIYICVCKLGSGCCDSLDVQCTAPAM